MRNSHLRALGAALSSLVLLTVIAAAAFANQTQPQRPDRAFSFPEYPTAGGLAAVKSGPFPEARGAASKTFVGDGVDHVTGVLHVIHGDDFKNRRASYKYLIEQSDGDVYDVNLGSSVAIEGDDRKVDTATKDDIMGMSGSEVRVTGNLDRTSVDAANLQVSNANPPGSPQQLTSGATTHLKVAVLLGKFTGEATPTVTVSDIRNAVFTGSNSANTFYQDDSSGMLDLVGIQDPTTNGDVFGYFTIPNGPGPTCGGGNAEADDTLYQAAQAQGIDPYAYDRIIEVLPNCGYSGFADAGNRRSWVYGSAWQTPGVFIHELGHDFRVSNVAVGHANSVRCRELDRYVAVGSTCEQREYGDSYDIMGNDTSQPHLNSAFLKTGLGFLNSLNTVDAQTPGDYTIAPSETALPSGTLQNLRIPRTVQYGSTSYDPTGPWYQIEYRQPHGQFDTFASTPAIVNGVLIRSANEYGAVVTSTRTKSWLVDATPETPSFSDSFSKDEALPDGKTFYDPGNDIMVRQLSHNASGATIRYSHAPPALQQATLGVQGGVLTYSGVADQDSRIFVDRTATGYDVVDYNAPLSVGPGCSATAANRAQCSASGVNSMSFSLNDLPDQITVDPTITAPIAIAGGDGDDTIVSAAGNDTISAGNGDDTIDAGPGGDDVHGDGGVDFVTYASRLAALNVSLDNAGGDGEIAAAEGDNMYDDIENLTGGEGNDHLVGNGSANVLNGGPGSDVLEGRAGTDTLTDGDPYDDAGNDTLIGGPDADVMTGGPGTDTVSYEDKTANVSASIDYTPNDGVQSPPEGDMIGNEIENITGGSGNDTLNAGYGSSRVDGGPGADVLLGGDGSDTLVGGAGNDTASYTDHNQPVTVSIGGIHDDGSVGEADTVSADIESISGTFGNDTLTGDAGQNTLAGSWGNDTLDGRGGADVLDGGTDSDTVTYADRTASVSASVDGVANDGEAGEGDAIDNVENLTGGSGADQLTGSDSAANTLRGGAGNDLLNGLYGDDSLFGDGGADTVTYAGHIFDVTADIGGNADGSPALGESDTIATDVENLVGGSANDHLSGDAGNNELTGGAGNDVLDGLGGGDTIDGGAGTDTVNAGAGSDILSLRDGVTDTADCGSEADTIRADLSDSISGCESADTTPDTTIVSGPAAGGYTPNNQLTFAFSADEGGATFECELDGGGYASCSSPYTSPTLGDGVHIFSARAKVGERTDQVPAVRSVTVDTVAPDTSLQGTVMNPTNDSTPSFSFTSNESGVTFGCRVYPAASTPGPFGACAAPYTSAALVPDGAYMFEVQAVDRAGNVDTSPASAPFGVDTVSPDTTITGPVTSPTGDTTPTWTFSASETGVFECRVWLASGTPGGWSSCSSPFTAATLAQDGTYSFEVRAIDTAGNSDSTPEHQDFVLESSTPTATITSGPAAGSTIGDTTPDFTFSAGEPATFECKFDAGGFAPCSSPYASPALVGGVHTFSVRATDSYAHTQSSPTTRSFTVSSAQVSKSGATITFAAGVDQRNDLVITNDGTFVTLHDTGGFVSPGVGCSTVAADTVSCATSGVTAINVTTADLDDRVVNNTAISSSLDGGTGNDELVGGTAADAFTGGGGTDTVNYGARTQALTVDIDGSGDDGVQSPAEGDNVKLDVEHVIGGAVADSITGSTSADTLEGGAGNDTLNGGDGNDLLLGGDDNDSMNGGNNNDTLDGGRGADVFNGNAGIDTADYSARTHPITVYINQYAGDGETGEGDQVNPGVENAIGGSANDDFIGDGADNVLTGNGGADGLQGGAGNDTLNGGTGSDFLSPGLGNDTVYGGNGTSDLVSYSERSTDITLSLDDQPGDGESGESDNVLSDVESVQTGNGNDTVTGSASDNQFITQGGDDTIDGGLGADYIAGGDGFDTATYASRTAAVYVVVTYTNYHAGGEAAEGDTVTPEMERVIGGSGNDVMSGEFANAMANVFDGGPGDDVLSGGDGNDTLTGGPGSDTLNGDRDDDVLYSSDGGTVDIDNCSLGNDTATVDAIDTVNPDCETVLGNTGVPPALNVDSPAQDETIASHTVPVSFTAGASAVSKTCKLDSGPVDTACASPKTYLGVADGNHTVTVTATDFFGNTNTVVRDFKVDTTPPSLTVDSPTQNQVVGSSTVPVSFTAGLDATAKTCQLDSGTVDNSCTSPKTYSAVAEGSHTATVTARDAVGNTNTVIRDFKVDLTAPQVTITAPTGTISTSTPTIQFNLVEANPGVSICQVKQGSTVLQTINPCISGTSTTSSLGGGTYDLVVTHTDPANNSGFDTKSFTITQVGAITVTAANASSTAVNLETSPDSTLDWAHWGTSNTLLPDHRTGGGNQISNASLVSGGTTATATGGTTPFTWTSGIPTASATNNTAGLAVGGTAGQGFRVTVPVSATGPKVLKLHVGVVRAGLSGAAAVGRLQVSMNDGVTSTVVDSSSSSSSSTVLNRMFTITYRGANAGTLTAEWTYTGGNSSSRVRLYAAQLTNGTDTTPPDTTVTPAENTVFNTTTPAFTLGSTEALPTSDPKFQCKLDNAATYSTCAAAYTAPALSQGKHKLTARAIDQSGNADPTPVVMTFWVSMPQGNIQIGSSSLLTIPSTVNLTTDGTNGWGHWGNTTSSTESTKLTPVRKSGTTATDISNATRLGSVATTRITSGVPTYSWNGAGDPSGSGTTTAMATGGATANGGLSFTMQATNTKLRTAKLYLGAINATGSLSVSISDGSFATQTAPSFITAGATAVNRMIPVSFRSASATATVTVSFTQAVAGTSASKVYIESVALVDNPDVTAPLTTITSGPADDSTTTNHTPTFAFNANEAGTTQCQVDGGTFTSCVSPFTTLNLASGSHSFAVRAIDSAGNIEPRPPTRTFVVGP